MKKRQLSLNTLSTTLLNQIEQELYNNNHHNNDNDDKFGQDITLLSNEFFEQFRIDIESKHSYITRDEILLYNNRQLICDEFYELIRLSQYNNANHLYSYYFNNNDLF